MSDVITETGNINAIGSAVGVGGPFMVIPLQDNNISQPAREESWLLSLFGQNNLTKVKKRSQEWMFLTRREGMGRKKRGLHLPSSLTVDEFDSCLVQFLWHAYSEKVEQTNGEKEGVMNDGRRDSFDCIWLVFVLNCVIPLSCWTAFIAVLSFYICFLQWHLTKPIEKASFCLHMCGRIGQGRQQ